MDHMIQAAIARELWWSEILDCLRAQSIHPLLCIFDKHIQTTDISQEAVSRNNRAKITR